MKNTDFSWNWFEPCVVMTGCDSIGSRMRRDWGSRFRHRGQGFESGCWSHLPSPVEEGTGWVLFVKTTVIAATVFEANA